MENQKKIGFLYVTISAILFSSKGVLIKLAYQEGVDAVSLLTFRMLFSAPFFILALVWMHLKFGPSKATFSDYVTMLLLGLIGYYFSSLLDFYGLKYVSAGLERLILFVYPSLVVFIGALFFKKKITKSTLISLFLTYIGILMVVVYDISSRQDDIWIGVLCIFFCAFTFAIYLVFSDTLVHKFGSVNYTSYILLASSAGIFIHYASTHEIAALGSYSPRLYGICTILGVLCTVIPSFLMTDGIKKIGSANTSIVATLGPIWTMIFAYLVIGEPITIVQILGTILVISGVVYASR